MWAAEISGAALAQLRASGTNYYFLAAPALFGTAHNKKKYFSFHFFHKSVFLCTQPNRSWGGARL
jgi:hypothetical protein